MPTRYVAALRASLFSLLLASCSHAAPHGAPGAAEATSGGASPAPSSAGASPVSSAPGAIHVRELVYTDGTTEMKGYIAYPQAEGPRPAVLVVHEWWGLNAYARSRAEQLAQLGYVALAVDMYGGGKNTTHAAEAQGFMTQATASAAEAKGRFDAALDALASDPRVDRERLAAIGYCFGGAVVLNAARHGAPLDLVASFHGALGTAEPMAKGAFKGKIFVANGAADKMIPAELVQKFKGEMDAAGAHYELVDYPGAQHGFSNPEATELGKANGIPLAYDAAADAASWAHLLELLAAL
jgi:dienelactone hydrolase